MMSGIRGANTTPELLVRKGLFARGLRYRLNDSRLPGKPDIVLPRYGAVIFVNGCFWHGHDCHLFKWPQSNADFWVKKIRSNMKNDERNLERLRTMDWRVAIVWECALKGKSSLPPTRITDVLCNWIKSDRPTKEISGRSYGAGRREKG